MSSTEQRSIIERLLAVRGMIRLRDAQAAGMHAETLRRMVAEGSLIRVGRGTYTLSTFDHTESTDLAMASSRVPHGVICLLSALAYHEIGTQLPHEVWMMIDRRAHRPRVDHPPMRFILGSGAGLTVGITNVTIDGQSVHISDPAKTVVDCFRYRRHVGLEVAIEALRESLRDGRCSASRISEYSERCRIASVMRPYLEALA